MRILITGATTSLAQTLAATLRETHQVRLTDHDVLSTDLAFVATNEVLRASGHPEITVEQYKYGCRFTTPERFNTHIGAADIGNNLKVPA